MTEFRFEHTFDGSAGDYWWTFFSDECTREQYEAVGVRDFDVIERTDDGQRVVRVVRVTPARELPGFIRKLTGASLSYTERTELDRIAGTATTEVTPATLGGRITVRGTHRIEALSGDRIERVFSGAIEARVPLVGGRIESAILADMESSYALSAGITQAWMNTHRDAPE